MAESQDLIDFDVIEQHKENIQALPSGRSAKALAQLYSPPLLGANPSPALTNDIHSKERAQFERELANIDEADDPLDVYDRYVKWTLDTYPSAQATPQSQLLPLLERATKAFQSSSHYKNDPRYLKLWLHYIRFFADTPREIFIFLARHGIGDGLALYFEEFAAWLENAGRWNQAEEIYKMGLEKEARPVERLLRKFGEFEKRKDARPDDAAEPSSPALPVVRPALAAKMDPFATASPAAVQQSASTGAKKSKSSKMAIFSDGDAPSRPDSSGSISRGWDNIGSLADRKKENTMEAKPWAGEKLKGGKTNGGMPKMMIFKDQSSRSSAAAPKHLTQRSKNSKTHEAQCIRNPKTGRLECVFVNLEAVYPVVGDLSVEYSFEELRAQHRGLTDKTGSRVQAARLQSTAVEESSTAAPVVAPVVPLRNVVIGQEQAVDDAVQMPKAKERGFKIFEDMPIELEAKPKKHDKILIETSIQTLSLNDENDENSAPGEQKPAPVKKVRREDKGNRTRKIKVMDIKHINETKTIQVNLDSPNSSKVKRKKSSFRPEPTMTINTKEAMDEIYGIFAQPLQSQAEPSDDEEDESDESDSSDDDDYTTDGESTATGKLSAAASEYGDETRHELLKGLKANENDQTENTGWSDFTMSKHALKGNADGEQDLLGDDHSDEDDEYEDDRTGNDQAEEELATPVDEDPRTLYNMSGELENYDHDRAPHLPNHRLPFMTPIVEQTESSLGAGTIRTDKNAYHEVKTPSRSKAGGGIADLLGEDDEPPSSPFEDMLADSDDDDDEDRKRVLQPIRTKSTKGTIALGQGTAKAQTAPKIVPSNDEPQKGPIIKDEQCNPMDPYLRQTILAEMKPPLRSFEGYFEHDANSGRAAEIKKFVKAQTRASKANSSKEEKTASALLVPPMVNLPGAHSSYTIRRELGAGTFAPVYLAENHTAADLDNEDAPAASRLGKAAHRRALEAIKMEEPASTWEFYMLRQCHRRLGVHRATDAIVRAHEMHLYRDECFLIEEYRGQGTLLDLVNLARTDGASANGSGLSGGMDEVMAMWCTVELLRTVEALHSKALIHGDLKADNILVRLDDPGIETDWSPTYFASGAHGWSSKGVCLIDFGRGIDMRHFVPNVGFLADWKTSEADCAEMRELRPWTYQIDYHGLAGVIHSLLFGKYMEILSEKNSNTAGLLGAAATKTYRIRENLKRYWQTELWAELFHLLLNPLAHVENEEGRKLPVVRGMRACRERLETWLEENCERGVGLKGHIARMEAIIRERRRKIGKV